MALTLAQARLIACRVMDPFVAERLLVKEGAEVKPTPSAMEVKINLVLHDLDEDDDTYGLHTIRFILQSLDGYCRDLGHTLILTSVELLDPDDIEFVDDLASLVKSRAKKL